MHLFGLTGGIASGKSTVAARLRAQGLPVIDADELARAVVAPQSEALEAILAAFGPKMREQKGTLDRKALGRLVFSDPTARRRLNAIVHPRIAELAQTRARELGEAGEPLACYEAALIVENGAADLYRPLVVVACPPEAQVARLRRRDGISQAEALARISAQEPLSLKLELADHVIDTSTTVAATEARTDDVLGAICIARSVDRARYFVR